MGVVPLGAVSRWYADEAGRLNQAVAATCEKCDLDRRRFAADVKG
ncbi:hypothetical protein ACFS07_23370 [Undibacterium arcticum]